MDPNANLEETRRLTARILADFDAERPVCSADAARLADLAQALDEWISRGGFLPVEWRNHVCPE